MDAVDALEAIGSNEIDGEMFIELNEEYLHEIAPKVCDRIRMKGAVGMALNLISLVKRAVANKATEIRLCMTVYGNCGSDRLYMRVYHK